VLASLYADEAEILSLAVVPEQRRKGIGNALLAACEEAWRKAGVRGAWLEVRRDNRGALKLYEQRGWTDAGLRRGYYEDGVDAVVMRWSGS
jgi:ribosomal-protein-alanine N-acetyltransferase